MKEYKVHLSPESRADLESIRVYVANISLAYYARLVVDRILDKIATLDRCPERTEPFAEDDDGRQLRNIIEGKYRIIYAVDRKESEVIISRIISVSQDPNRL